MFILQKFSFDDAFFFFFFLDGRKCFFPCFFWFCSQKNVVFLLSFIHSVIFVWLRKHFLPQKCETNLKIMQLLAALCSSWRHAEIFPSSEQRGNFPRDQIPLAHPELPPLARSKGIPVPEVGPCPGAELPGDAFLGLPYSLQPFPALPIHLPRLRAMDGATSPAAEVLMPLISSSTDFPPSSP